jgi:murein DD-endopeptidase MepM/ murein hydrolase activator NlpD
VFQIVLLPQKDYWDWVRACRKYVLTFGAHLTPDPSAAARYMAPRQVITFPNLMGAFAEGSDIQAWFASNHPEVMLDPVAAADPASFEVELDRRVTEEDRFGQKDRPFFMLWPTEYPVITQRFGANARIYSRFGMPGHEGVDIRALPNTKIFACAEGDIYRVEKNPKGHSYGIHVRIRHQGGFRTIYGHLARAEVEIGQHVEAGQVIGTADSTGASVGSHLHLSLKQDHATESGQTNYPKDIIDPTKFLVWPDTAWPKTVELWGPGKCLIGAHGRIGDVLNEDDLRVIENARLEALVIELSESDKTIARLRELQPAIFLMSRLETDFSDDHISPKRFVSNVQKGMDALYRHDVRYFEVAPNPNLQNAGWMRSWPDGAGFGRWFKEVTDRLRDRFPDARLGFPGLSPGILVPGKREDQYHFLDGADEAILGADWIGLNIYWTTTSEMEQLSEGQAYEEYRLRYPNKLLFVTEFGNPAENLTSSLKANQYLEFYRQLRERPGIGAAFAFAISAREGHTNLVWQSSRVDSERMANTIGSRKF